MKINKKPFDNLETAIGDAIRNARLQAVALSLAA